MQPVRVVARVRRCLDEFRRHAEQQSAEWLTDLWEACEHGAKPLGCWCVTATHGDGQDCVCHAQILAAMLHERFGRAEVGMEPGGGGVAQFGAPEPAE